MSSTIYEKIATQIIENADAVAVQQLTRSISYADLGKLSASVTEQLLLHGCPRETLVPIITRGGIDMVAGMVGSLRAATTFVPIDVDAPSERTRQMLRDLASDVAIADTGLDCSELILPGMTVIHPSMEMSCGDTKDLEDHTLIYGFFTSGSTGRPKCCLNTHLGLSNRFAFNSSVRPIGCGDAILQNSKHTFDPVLWQVLWPLTRGAKVVIPDREGLLDMDETVETISREHVVMTDIVPSVLSVLLDYLERHQSQRLKLQSLKDLFVGGDEISTQLVQRSMKLLPWVRLTNTYGPTEAAIGMIYHHFDGTETVEVPLGKPIPNTFCHILGENCEPLGNGEIGQLAIGGDCLGAGYLHDPVKTAALFRMVDTSTGQQRVFLTGDRATVLDGKVYFKGRTDKQIKIRGVRIELKEIESAFEAHSEIIQLRVVPVSSDVAETRLHAFFTAHSALDEVTLRRFGRSRLPPEFIPSSFQRLDRFETTSSGKIDRHALKKLTANQEPLQAYPDPGAIEKIVKKYVREAVGPDANLFDMGLDSLNAVRLCMDLEDVLDIKVPASYLYENPTITDLQALVGSTSRNARNSVDAGQDLSRWSRISFKRLPLRPKILLTGATGYLGSYLLSLLSRQEGVEVHCLVRASSKAKAMLRLHQCSLSYGLHQQTDWNPVQVLPGDLALEGLGLHPSDYEIFSSSLVSIYNCGAEVNFVKPFSHLEAVNVLSVRSLAELALSVQGCHLHHISSTSAIPPDERHLDSPPTATFTLPAGGYAQSKLAAEILLTAAGNEGLPSTIYRVGELMPSPSHPALNPKSNVIAYLKTLVELGVAPMTDDSLDYCPVDVVARAIIGSDRAPSNVCGIANQRRVSQGDIIKALNRAGAMLRPLEPAEVYRLIAEAATQPTAADHIAITWATIKDAGPDAHWPVLSPSPRPIRRTGGLEDWPELDELYLASALHELVPPANLNAIPLAK